jgi:hypothetical protein
LRKLTLDQVAGVVNGESNVHSVVADEEEASPGIIARAAVETTNAATQRSPLVESRFMCPHFLVLSVSEA